MTRDDLWWLLARQEGLIALGQAEGLGLTRRELRRALGPGWIRVLPEVVYTGSGPPTCRHRMIAALLHAGPDAVLASFTAAHRYGVDAAAHPLVHVAVPAACRARSAGFVMVRRVRRPDPGVVHRGPLALASPVRAVASAARDATSASTARAVIGEAVARRVVTPDGLREELGTVGRGRGQARRALADVEAAARTVRPRVRSA